MTTNGLTIHMYSYLNVSNIDIYCRYAANCACFVLAQLAHLQVAQATSCLKESMRLQVVLVRFGKVCHFGGVVVNATLQTNEGAQGAKESKCTWSGRRLN